MSVGHLVNLINQEQTAKQIKCQAKHAEEVDETINVIYRPLGKEAAQLLRTELESASTSYQVLLIGPDLKRPRTDDGSKWTIIFTERDLDRV